MAKFFILTVGATQVGRIHSDWNEARAEQVNLGIELETSVKIESYDDDDTLDLAYHGYGPTNPEPQDFCLSRTLRGEG